MYARLPHISLLLSQVRIDPVTCDLVAPLLPRLLHHVDVLIFNPPYVPTEEEEALNAQVQGDIAGAWAGGFDGMAITNRLLDDLGVSPNNVSNRFQF